MITFLPIVLCVLLLFSSCMVTRTSVGSYKEQAGTAYTYSKGKQCYLFWGLVPIGVTSLQTPTSGDCEVRTSYNFVDWLITGITGGIFSMQSIKVKAKSGEVASAKTSDQITVDDMINNVKENVLEDDVVENMLKVE